eukprot:TRINITY_DN2492_c0_g2_i1.p1 TRINITY_DN2492_c0_g2~~TRINITY_DN2492_c0_g2_i1.p1  ORF type:complete len:406 (-),score=117.00 TRINITY_DN2492_c0_g2_i1:18-1235(-)
MKLTVSSIFILFFILISFSYSQFSTGGFIATNSYTKTLWAWNTTSNSSTIEACKLKHSDFGPVYTTNVATREFIYLHSSSEESSYDIVTSQSFTWDESSNTFTCGNITDICNGNGKWRTNSTARIFADPSNDQYVMVDTLFINVLDEYVKYYEVRVWTFSTSNCELNFVDSFKMSPILEETEDIVDFDPSNHRLYFIYDTIEDFNVRRLRAVDVRSGTLLYDYDLSLIDGGNTPFMQFDPNSGYLILLLGASKLYSGALFNPIQLNVTYPSNYYVNRTEIGPDTVDFSINWREGVIVAQHYVDKDGYYLQTAWDTLTGEIKDQIIFNTYVDNGWYYDPLIQVQQININTGTESDLEKLPGITSAAAKNIVDHRNREGIYHVVEDLLHVNGVTLSMYRGFRPYTAV